MRRVGEGRGGEEEGGGVILRSGAREPRGKVFLARDARDQDRTKSKLCKHAVILLSAVRKHFALPALSRRSDAIEWNEIMMKLQPALCRYLSRFRHF